MTWIATAHSGLPATEDNETGNASCTQTIIVNDVVAPTITASPQTASADASCQAAIPDFTATATVSDNCACASSDTSENCQDRQTITVTQTPAPGTLVGLGPHTITLTANDGSSNNDGAGNTATIKPLSRSTTQPHRPSLLRQTHQQMLMRAASQQYLTTGPEQLQLITAAPRLSRRARLRERL